MNNSIKMLAIVATVVLFASCSNKTKNATQKTATESAQEERVQQNGPKKSGPKKGGPPVFSDLLEKMDTNKDGKIAIAEAQGRLKENFTKMDGDADGFLTATEFKNAPRPERPKSGGAGGRN